MVGLILNNVFIQALHVVVGEKVLNTLSNHAICTVAFGAILTVIYIFFTLPRTLADLSWLSVFSAVTMFISVILGMIFSGVEDHPFGYPEYGTQIISSAWAAPGTTFVAGMSAMLNITYTLMYLHSSSTFPHILSVSCHANLTADKSFFLLSSQKCAIPANFQKSSSPSPSAK